MIGRLQHLPPYDDRVLPLWLRLGQEGAQPLDEPRTLTPQRGHVRERRHRQGRRRVGVRVQYRPAALPDEGFLHQIAAEELGDLRRHAVGAPPDPRILVMTSLRERGHGAFAEIRARPRRQVGVLLGGGLVLEQERRVVVP